MDGKENFWQIIFIQLLQSSENDEEEVINQIYFIV